MVSDAKDTFPAFEGKMGSRKYWLTMWAWGRVKRSISFARDLNDYGSLAPAEKIQRDINSRRVAQQIVPYLLTNPDRFFGALIVEGRGSEPQFTPLPGFSGYGTLEISDDVIFYCLDGQHRLAAIRDAIDDEADLAQEQQSVILVWHENTIKTRKLFIHLNKYAKATTTATNILLDDEDLYAEITRRLERNLLLFKNRTNWKGNTLSPTSQNVTTAPVLAHSSKTFLDEHNIRQASVEMEEEHIDRYYQEVEGIWKQIIANSPVFAEVDRGVLTMANLRETYILLTPVGQMTMINALQGARVHGVGLEEITKRLGKVDWSKRDDFWNRIIYSRDLDRMITAKENVTAMGRILAYCLGGDYSTEEQAELFRVMQAYQPERKELPQQIS